MNLIMVSQGERTMSSTVLQAAFREYFYPAPQVGSVCVNITTVTHGTKGWMAPAIK